MANSLWEMSTTAASNTSIGGANASEGCAPSSVNDAQRAAVAMTLGAQIGVTAAGTDTYTATLAPAPTTYTSGMELHIRFTNANTGAATLNINGLGAKSIVKNGSAALVAGDIPALHEGILRYNGTNLVLMNPLPGTGTVTSVSDAANGGVTVTNGTTTATVALNVSDLSAATPTQASTLAFEAGAGTKKATLANAANSLVDVAAATQAQMETGTATTVLVVPGRLKFHPNIAAIGCRVNQASATAALVTGSFGVSSITDGATGIFTINHSANFDDTNYMAQGAVMTSQNREVKIQTRAVGSTVINTFAITTAGASDVDDVNVHIWGNLA